MRRGEAREARRLGAGDRFVIATLGVLVVIAVALAALRSAHILPLHGEIVLFLPILIVLLLLGWGASALFRRVRGRTARVLVGVGLGLLLFVLVTVAFTYVSFIATVSLPRPYTTLTSPSGGRKLAVLRSLDTDEARIGARKAARLAGDPDGDPDTIVDDWGYVYAAYPRVARFFYRNDVDAQGEVVIGYTSDATLMVEWAEGETQARFYADNPGVADGGELVVKF